MMKGRIKQPFKNGSKQHRLLPQRTQSIHQKTTDSDIFLKQDKPNSKMQERKAGRITMM